MTNGIENVIESFEVIENFLTLYKNKYEINIIDTEKIFDESENQNNRNGKQNVLAKISNIIRELGKAKVLCYGMISGIILTILGIIYLSRYYGWLGLCLFAITTLLLTFLISAINQVEQYRKDERKC